MTPHRFCRPRTCLPPMTIDFSDPTTAKGMMCWIIHQPGQLGGTKTLTLICAFSARSSSSNSSLS